MKSYTKREDLLLLVCIKQEGSVTKGCVKASKMLARKRTPSALSVRYYSALKGKVMIEIGAEKPARTHGFKPIVAPHAGMMPPPLPFLEMLQKVGARMRQAQLEASVVDYTSVMKQMLELSDKDRKKILDFFQTCS